MTLDELLTVAAEAARVGGATILAAGRTREAEEKSAGDYVTAVDGASEQAIAVKTPARRPPVHAAIATIIR